jgi:hypothetical protein
MVEKISLAVAFGGFSLRFVASVVDIYHLSNALIVNLPLHRSARHLFCPASFRLGQLYLFDNAKMCGFFFFTFRFMQN